MWHIFFEEHLNSGKERLEKFSAIQTSKLVTLLKDEKREMIFLKKKVKLRLLLPCKTAGYESWSMDTLEYP